MSRRARLPRPGVVALDDTAGCRIGRVWSRGGHCRTRSWSSWAPAASPGESGSATWRHAADCCNVVTACV